MPDREQVGGVVSLGVVDFPKPVGGLLVDVGGSGRIRVDEARDGRRFGGISVPGTEARRKDKTSLPSQVGEATLRGVDMSGQGVREVVLPEVGVKPDLVGRRRRVVVPVRGAGFGRQTVVGLAGDAGQPKVR